MEYHWFEGEPVRYCAGSYRETAILLRNKTEKIYSNQSTFISTNLLDSGYRIFLHFSSGDVFEIKYGVNPRTGREIRPGHHLERLLLAGEFGELSV